MALAQPSDSRPRKRGLHVVNPLRLLVFGRPIKTEHHEHALLPKVLALPVFASDAISSSVYATQEILLALAVAGTGALVYTIHISIAIALLLTIVAISYWQTVHAYPTGGGSYIVAKDNIGANWGLIAAAALLIDYVLTVATSIASGVQNLVAMPFMHRFHGHEVLICVLAVLLLSFANLRGLKESGSVFAIPTYAFVVSCYALIGFGLLGLHTHLWHLGTAEPSPSPLKATENVGLALILAAFARGCSALTGTEAISNGVPAFKAPQSDNAAKTLAWMAFILGTLFVGVSYLAVQMHVVYVAGSLPVIDQLNAIVFGKGSWFYYVLQFATVLILVLAANTSFADFPRLSSILARDRYVPRQLANIGDKLTFSNGIALLGIFSALLLVVFGGNTDRLIPLYAIGVFIAFSLSQSGMVIHWWKERGKGWAVKAAINGMGALATFIVMCTIGYEKVVADILFDRGREFGWIIIVLIVLLFLMFRAINKHYMWLRSKLSLASYHATGEALSNTVLLLVPSLHSGVMQALQYARSLSPDCRAIHIEIEPPATERLIREWNENVGDDLPLVVLPSPYRSLIGPLMAYLEEVTQERANHTVTVVVPEFVSNRWWHSLLHNASGLLVKFYLLKKPGVIVTNVRYHLGGDGEATTSANTGRATPPAGQRPGQP